MSEARVLHDADWLRRRKLDVAEYHRMGEAGILTRDDRVELVEGELIEMAPIGSGHAGAGLKLGHALFPAVGSRARIGANHPLQTGPHTELQPDFVLLRPRADDYLEANPRPEDVLLLIEIADSSLRYDRAPKLRLYGAAGIIEYWIVNLPERVVEVCRGPTAAGYARIERFGPEAELSPEALPEVRLRLAEILP